ncbi:divergent polysaccharide deacetylase family protein [Rhizobium sp. Leaf341]|uniref:divergent polysaccharide deacetylase family protein n=1 Tax=Rhizobium sp. Leaf341 TaxID=1736344 RepID=UPI00071548C1|nr:divergent polysaccharide deacetylase family protein [Rhizobium sp. Leaf341]KQR79295.1 hypothetical protein ASG03_12175 [Rhizobium sp. Leaf341]
MGTDLNAPLGQNRRPAKTRTRLRMGRVALGLFATAIAGVTVFAWMTPLGLLPPAPLPASTEIAAAPSAGQTEDSPKAPVKAGSRSTGEAASSGASINRTLLDNGNVVTTYSPGQRGKNGPAIIEVGPVRGQDPRMAAQPNELLLEDAPEGRLPVIGPDGLRPMDQYARPWSGARGTRIALVIGGMGLSQTGTQSAIRTLPPAATLAFAASGNSLQRWMQEARRTGHEILLQVPLEPFDYPTNNPGPQTLLVGDGARQNLAQLHDALGKITNYTGIMNFLGGRFLSNAEALEPVMREIGQRGLLFLDDGTSAQSLTSTLGDALNVPYAFGDVVVDTQLDRTAILRKLDDLERIARRNGTAIGTASAFDESVSAIAQWMDEAEKRGIEFVGVSALVKDTKRN